MKLDLHTIAGAAKAWGEVARGNLISGIADVQKDRLQMDLPDLLSALRNQNENLATLRARVTSNNYFCVDVDGITFFAILDKGDLNEFVGALNEEALNEEEVKDNDKD